MLRGWHPQHGSLPKKFISKGLRKLYHTYHPSTDHLPVITQPAQEAKLCVTGATMAFVEEWCGFYYNTVLFRCQNTCDYLEGFASVLSHSSSLLHCLHLLFPLHVLNFLSLLLSMFPILLENCNNPCKNLFHVKVSYAGYNIDTDAEESNIGACEYQQTHFVVLAQIFLGLCEEISYTHIKNMQRACPSASYLELEKSQHQFSLSLRMATF